MLIRRKKRLNNLSFSELRKGKAIMAFELVNGEPVVRVGYLESLKNGIMTAYYPSLEKSLKAKYINNNWVLIGED